MNYKGKCSLKIMMKCIKQKNLETEKENGKMNYKGKCSLKITMKCIKQKNLEKNQKIVNKIVVNTRAQRTIFSAGKHSKASLTPLLHS